MQHSSPDLKLLSSFCFLNWSICVGNSVRTHVSQISMTGSTHSLEFLHVHTTMQWVKHLSFIYSQRWTDSNRHKQTPAHSHSSLPPPLELLKCVHTSRQNVLRLQVSFSQNCEDTVKLNGMKMDGWMDGLTLWNNKTQLSLIYLNYNKNNYNISIY